MLRIWLPAALLIIFSGIVIEHLVRAHLDPEVDSVNYTMRKQLPARRGSILDIRGRTLVRSVPVWEYRLDPVGLTNRLASPSAPRVCRRGKPRTVEAVAKTIAHALGLETEKVLKMTRNRSNRYQFLAKSADSRAHEILANSKLVAGISIEDRQIRQYLCGRRLCHVLGSYNSNGGSWYGIEQRYNEYLRGTPGEIQGVKDALQHEIYDRRVVSVDPVPGADVYLTIDQTLQYEVENALAAGVKEYGAASGWSIVMDARTGAIMAMASLPDFCPSNLTGTAGSAFVNRACASNYEPGSVMKVITAAAAIDVGLVTADTLYSTDRNDERYYRLAGDGSHKWEPQMSIRDAVVHSSNIVIGKLGCDLGSERLCEYLRAFGFGARTGVELPGEEKGQLSPGRQWDPVKRSRVPIGQGVSVTALQLCSAYQAIANDGLRMKPHIVSRVVASDGVELYRHIDTPLGHPIRPTTARTVREMMRGVAKKGGTAWRAAIPGYSIAGKTGTAQKTVDGKYSERLHIATFCGIVPASEPRFVALVTLDFDESTKFHQGGNSAAPIWKDIASVAVRYLGVEPDLPEELIDLSDDAE